MSNRIEKITEYANVMTDISEELKSLKIQTDLGEFRGSNVRTNNPPYAPFILEFMTDWSEMPVLGVYIEISKAGYPAVCIDHFNLEGTTDAIVNTLRQVEKALIDVIQK